VVTEERWFLGTQVRLTLTDSGESTVANWITANAIVVRWGNDGVGLKFVIEEEKGEVRAQPPLVCGIEKKELNRFLELAKSGKRCRETGDAVSRSEVLQGDTTQNTDAQLSPLGVGVLPIGDELGGNSSLMGVSTDTALVNSPWEGIEGVEALHNSDDPSPASCIRANIMVSPIKREEVISGHTDLDFHDLFIGPIDSSLLIDSLKDLPRPVSVAGASSFMNLSDSSPMQLSAVASSTPLRRRPCILLIDDEYLDITFLAGTLEEDYEIMFSTDGVSALESAGCYLPDLILLDVMMPGMDGFEVCRRLKADFRTKEIPVIFITGLSEAAAETKGLRIGAVDYISKPFNAAPLKARVDMQVKLRME
jgi:CheY-like chemotaxis protein